MPVEHRVYTFQHLSTRSELMINHPRRLYCYVDETGQDTRSKSFIVVTVIVISDTNRTRRLLKNIEEISGKVQHKWTKTTVTRRVSYCQNVIDRPEFVGTIFYSRFLRLYCNKCGDNNTPKGINPSINFRKYMSLLR